MRRPCQKYYCNIFILGREISPKIGCGLGHSKIREREQRRKLCEKKKKKESRHDGM